MQVPYKSMYPDRSQALSGSRALIFIQEQKQRDQSSTVANAGKGRKMVTGKDSDWSFYPEHKLTPSC